MLPRRETFIALRARRTAYRIATDFLTPYIETPRAPIPVSPWDEHEHVIELTDDDLVAPPQILPAVIMFLTGSLILLTISIAGMRGWFAP
jgi:hypothetical protein